MYPIVQFLVFGLILISALMVNFIQIWREGGTFLKHRAWKRKETLLGSTTEELGIRESHAGHQACSAAGVKWLREFLIPHPSCLVGTSQPDKHVGFLPVQSCNMTNHKSGLVRRGKLLKRTSAEKYWQRQDSQPGTAEEWDSLWGWDL